MACSEVAVRFSISVHCTAADYQGTLRSYSQSVCVTLCNHCYSLQLIFFLFYHSDINVQPYYLFQCQPSLDQNGVYTPNIFDSYFNVVTAARLRMSNNLTDTVNRHTYIFTIPSDSHNCSGTVRSIQYCYRIRNNAALIRHIMPLTS